MGTLGAVEVYRATLPVPKYSSMSSIAIATKVDIEGNPIEVKVLDLDDYAILYGIEENKSLLQGQVSSLIASILKRTPTAKLARAVVTAVLLQLAKDHELGVGSSGDKTISLCNSIDSPIVHVGSVCPVLNRVLIQLKSGKVVGKDDHSSDKDQGLDTKDSDIELVDIEDATEADNVVITKDEIMDAQSNDSDIRKIHSVVRTQQSLQNARDNGNVDNEKLALVAYKKAVKEAGKQLAGIAQSTYEDADGLLYYADSNRQFPVPIINAALGEKAITMAHGMMLTAHIGIHRCRDFIRLRYWWIGMRKDIEHHIRHCIHCQKAKFEAQPGYGFAHLRFYAGPGQCIAIDIVVLNHTTARGTKYFFTILDCFSHWPEAIPVVSALHYKAPIERPQTSRNGPH